MKLVPVKNEDKNLFWNINQKYLYEMTNYYPEELDENGDLHYGYFDGYFIDPKRKAFFLYEEDKIVGFAMINPYSYFGGETDNVLAEFTILPMYRHNHMAIKAIKLLFEQFKGKWEIKYNINNIAAKSLWNKVTKQYNPKLLQYSDVEIVLTFSIE